MWSHRDGGRKQLTRGQAEVTEIVHWSRWTDHSVEGLQPPMSQGGKGTVSSHHSPRPRGPASSLPDTGPWNSPSYCHLPRPRSARPARLSLRPGAVPGLRETMQVSVSPEGGHYIYHCLGPGLPYSLVRRSADHQQASYSLPLSLLLGGPASGD